jgi:hypothetical protein
MKSGRFSQPWRCRLRRKVERVSIDATVVLLVQTARPSMLVGGSLLLSVALTLHSLRRPHLAQRTLLPLHLPPSTISSPSCRSGTALFTADLARNDRNLHLETSSRVESRLCSGRRGEMRLLGELTRRPSVSRFPSTLQLLTSVHRARQRRLHLNPSVDLLNFPLESILPPCPTALESQPKRSRTPSSDPVPSPGLSATS